MGLLGSLAGKIPGMGGESKPKTPKAATSDVSQGIVSSMVNKMVKRGKNGTKVHADSSAAMTE